MPRASEGATYCPSNGVAENHFRRQESVTAYLHFSPLLRRTFLRRPRAKNFTLLAVLLPEPPLKRLGKSLRAPLLLSPGVNSFHRHFDNSNIQVSLRVALAK